MTNNKLMTTSTNKDLITFDENQLKLIKSQIAVNATNDELQLFLYQCKRTGLDPLARQIHFQKFEGKNGNSDRVSFITTIDGYRLIADRTGNYVGSNDAVFEGRIAITDGGNYDKIDKAPAKAIVTVLKLVHGQPREFTASAYWEEYYPYGTRGHMWRKMPHVMLAKCAEAQALRKAFPADLSGVYTQEEMEQAGIDVIDGEFVSVEEVEQTKQGKGAMRYVKPNPPVKMTPPQQKQQAPQQPAQPAQSPREWLASKQSLTYGMIANALIMTDKFDNIGFAMDTVEQFPNYPASFYGEDGQLLDTAINESMPIKQQSALAVFDWCLNNTGATNETA